MHIEKKDVRVWLPSIWMFAASTLSYVDRIVLAILAPTILAATKMTVEQYGWVISCFSIAYMVSNPIWGRILDRIGVRRGMSVAVAGWSLASALHALAAGPFSFGVFRGLLGAGEGATFGGGVKTAVLTLPKDKRSIGTALSYTGGAIGAIATPLFITPLALRFGWHAAFLVTGGLGLAWLIGWRLIVRADPRLGRQPVAEDTPKNKVTILSRSTIAYICAYGLGAFPLGFVLNSLPLYLSRGLHMGQAAIGSISWVPPLGWEAGFFFWGFLADRYGKNLSALRRMMTVALLLTLPLAYTASTASVAMVMAIGFLALFAAAGFLTLALVFVLRRHSESNSAYLTGIGAGSWSAVVAVAMPHVGKLFDHRAFGGAFYLATIIPVCGYALWVVLSRSQEEAGVRAPTPTSDFAGTLSARMEP